ncbi:unnamed protein product [Fraxinus pennsylvanica]|uniref:Uncharacterized protein n=1 Tax=Fraxinus pennsylvanica TaxID=56036 RepID=A0AAD2AAP3_9LAMI|nr:unnamed protein product [Fraxinus pennsylvanica]
MCEKGSNFLRRAIYLPPRSMLLISGDGRYALHHYIPHHKVDKVKDSEIRRCSRRVSLTLSKNSSWGAATADEKMVANTDQLVAGEQVEMIRMRKWLPTRSAWSA